MIGVVQAKGVVYACKRIFFKQKFHCENFSKVFFIVTRTQNGGKKKRKKEQMKSLGCLSHKRKYMCV